MQSGKSYNIKEICDTAITANQFKHVGVVERYTPRSFLTFLRFLTYREYRNYSNYWEATETPREKKKVSTDEQSWRAVPTRKPYTRAIYESYLI